jgi:hypothetical protein
MLHTVKRMLVVAALATTCVIASIGTAQASTSSARLVSSVAAVASQPTTSIEGRGSALKFIPKTVTAGAVAGACSSTNYSFLIVNKTKATQQIVYRGSVFGSPIPPKNGLLVCGSGAIKGTFSLQADPKAKLKFNIT